MASIITLSVIFGLILFTWIFHRDFFTPVTVYLASYSFTLGISFLDLDPAMTPFKIKTWFFLIGGSLAFILGYALVRLVWFTYYPTTTVIPPQHQPSYDWKRHLFWSLGVLLFYLTGVGYLINKIGGLTVLQSDVHLIMNRNFNMGLWSYVSASFPAVILLFGVASFSSINPHRRIRIFSRVVVFFVLVLAMMTFPSRGIILLSIGCLVIMYNFLRKKVSPGLIMMGVLLGITLFIGLAFARNQYGTDLKGLVVKKVLLLPYLYFANNYWNLDYAINPPTDRDIHPFTYGLDFFNGFTEATPVGYQLQIAYHWDNLFNDRIQKVDGLNTIIYLWEVYKDLGLFGVIFFPALIGGLIGWLYHRMLAGWSPRIIIFYCMVLFQIAWSFMVETYKSGLVWLWVFLILGVTALSRKRLQD